MAATMKPNLSLQIPYSPPQPRAADAVSVSSPTYTPLTERRRSLLSIAGSLHSLNSISSLSSSSLRSSKNAIQRYWPGAKSPTVRGDYMNWNAIDASSTVSPLSEDYVEYPEYSYSARMQRPADTDDPLVKSALEQTIPRSVTKATKPIHRKPLPPTIRSTPGLPAPQRIPPPPPIPELSAVNYSREDYVPNEIYEMSSQPSEAAPFIRRAKTPVHRIGQLEMAALHGKSNMNGINRMSSVSTIAREYRQLVEYPEVPDSSPKHTNSPQHDDSQYVQDATGFDFGFAEPSQPITIPIPPTHDLHLSSSLSDDGTLLGSEPDTSLHKHLSSSSDASLETVEDGKKDAGEPAASSLRFQIGLQLLTKELSAALADRCRTDDRSSAGLQVWVMIEAYERLRDQLEATGSQENKEAMVAIDSWLQALHMIHNDIACDGAGGDSDYEN